MIKFYRQLVICVPQFPTSASPSFHTRLAPTRRRHLEAVKSVVLWMFLLPNRSNCLIRHRQSVSQLLESLRCDVVVPRAWRRSERLGTGHFCIDYNYNYIIFLQRPYKMEWSA